MQKLSVVIICKNEAEVIGRTLQSLEGLCDDIIVYDNGSTDNTIEQVQKFKVQLHKGAWEGFGKTKNNAIALAKHDWILSLDADEVLSEELKKELLQWQPGNEKTVCQFSFRNFIGNKMLRYGDWGFDYHIRLFNRKAVQWNEADVHEELILPTNTGIKRFNNSVLHHTWRNIEDYKNKMQRYALLGAEKYFKQEKKAGWVRQNVAPLFSFVRSYIFRLGFLDGKAGYQCAKMTAYYTFLKYKRLKELWKNDEQKNKE